ncbi:F-box protein [Rhodotorula paludigena]|uniref:F-box protein n=1 Tax=Rhodotorula paludigena TaxID=86838 RepID=UPI00317E7797
MAATATTPAGPPDCPFARVPNEIVLHIFDHARLAHDADAAPYRLADSDPVHSRRRINPVVAVSHVCRAWRALASENSALWASLHLDGEMDGARAQDKARLQHFGETFTALEELEIRANQYIQDMARADRGIWRIPPPPASLLSIPPDFLPPPTVETGSKGFSHARVLDPSHMPALEYADLGRTTPNVNLGLLAHSSGTLSHLRVRNWWIPPAFPLPDILGSLPILATLSLLASGALATRILDELVRLDAATPIRFPYLVTLAMEGARLTQAHLALFGSDRAARLATLDLSDTKAVAAAEGAASLELPRFDALTTLKVARSEVWSTARSIVDELGRGKMPALTQLYVSGSGEDEPVSGAEDDGWNVNRRRLLGERGIELHVKDGGIV